MKLDPHVLFKFLNQDKPKDYVIFMTSETDTKGMTIEVASPEDRVFEIEYKEELVIFKDGKSTKSFINAIDKSVLDIIDYAEELINKSLEDE